MPDKITQVYNAYKADGATKAQSEQQFRNWMVGDNYRRGVYNDLVKQGANVGTFEHFTQALGYKMNPKPQSKAAQQAVAYKAPQVPESWRDFDISNFPTSGMELYHPKPRKEDIVPAHGAKRPKKKPAYGDAGILTPLEVVEKITGQKAVMPVYRKKKEGKYWNPFTETDMGDGYVLDWSTTDENGDKVANVDKKQNFEAEAAAKALARALAGDANYKGKWAKFDKEFSKHHGLIYHPAEYTENKNYKEEGFDDNSYYLYKKYAPKMEDISNLLGGRSSEIIAAASKLGMTPEGFLKQYLAPEFGKKNEKEFRKRGIEHFMPKNAWENMKANFAVSSAGSAANESLVPKEYQNMRNEAVDEYSERNKKIMDEKGVFSAEGLAALGSNFAGGSARVAPDVVGFYFGGGEAKLTTAILSNGWKFLRSSGIVTKILGKAAPTLAKLTEKYGTETAAKMVQAASNSSASAFLRAGTRQFGHGALTMGFFEGNNYLMTEGREKLKEGKVGEVVKGFYTHGMSGLGTGMLFGGIGMGTGFFGRGLGITGKELTKAEVLKHGAEKAAYSAAALFAEGLGFKAEELYDEAKRGELTFGSVLENGGKGIIDKITMDLGMGAGKGKLPNLKRMLVGATHNTTGGVKFSATEKNEILNSTGGKSLLEGLDEVGRQGKMPPMYKGATAFFSDPNVSRRTKQKVAYVLGKTIDTNIPRTERVSITQGEKGTQVVRTYSKDGELLSVDVYANKEKAEMAKQEVYMKRDRDDFLALWNDSIQPTQKESNAMFEEIASRMGESDLGVFLAKLEDAESNGDADFLSKYEKIKNEVAGKFFGDKDKARLDVMRDVNDEYGVDIDKVLDKDPTLWKDNERDAVKELGNRLKNGTADKNDEESNKAVAHQDGADLSEQTELEDSEKFTESARTVNDRQTSATAAWMEMVKNTPELEEWMKNNPDATVEEMRDNFGDDVADAYMELSKAKSMKDGFIQNTSQKIEDAVQNQVAQARFTGTMQNKQGSKVATDNTVTIFSDKDGNEYTLVGGDVIADTAGDGSYSVGKSGLVIFRDKDGNTVQRTNFDGLTEVGTLSAEEYANRIRTTLQEQKTAEIQSSETPLPEVQKEEPKNEGGEAPTGKEKETKDDEPPLNKEDKSIVNDGKGGTDNTGNVLNSDGSIYTEPVKSIEEIADEDFDNPTRSIELPAIPQNVSSAIGADGKPVIIKKNIFEKNATNHPELDAADSRAILANALYNPNLIGQTQPVKRPSYKVAVQTGDKNSIVVLDVYNDKKQVEIVGWRLINEKGLAKMKRQAEREGGQFLILSPKDGSAAALSTLPHGLSSNGKGTIKSADSQENNETLTFKDGTAVPMNEKGEPDFSKITPEQGAELYEENFGADAESTLANERKAAEKALKDANKMKISGSGWSEKVKAKKEKETAIAAAQAEIDRVDAIQKALTAKKVEGTLAASKPEIADGEEANTAGSVVAEKFQKASKVVGRKGSRTLADGTKIKGTYMIVPAESLTASHDATNGYKKSEGFPVNAEGRTINDRDYEHDKDAQDVTEQMGAKYDGQAVNQVPTVSDEGVVYDGNGRTMAGQLAAKKGTDKEYIEALKENAEAFGLTAEDVDKIEHPRVIFVPEERLPYDTETFARFNRDEKKSQSNTQEAIANSKKLSAKDVGAIISEMESSGSLDSFFNNPKAINELVKTLVEKGVIGQNEVAGLMDGDLMSAKGREFVQNLLLGAVFKEDTLKVMGIEKGLKSKALNAMRQIMDNAKLGEYSLREEIDKAVQLLYEAKRKGYTVDGLLRQPEMFGESASERYPIEVQIMAKALEGKVADFKEIMEAYNKNAQAFNTGEADMFGEKPTKEEFINEILKLESWKKYDTRKEKQAEQGTVDDGGTEESEPKTRGDNEEGAGGIGKEEFDEGIKEIATEITKQTGVEVVTDEKTGQEVIDNAEADGTTLKYSKREKPAPKKTQKVYKLMRLGDDGKLYPLFIDATAPTELGVWYDADSPDLSMLKDLPSGVHLVNPKTKKTMTYEQFYNEHPELFNGKMSKYPSKEAIKWATQNGMRFMYIEDTKKAQKRFEGEHRKYWNLGVNGSGTVSTFSMRPGWHAGSLPTMRQIGKGENKDLRDDRFVWVEGEVSADKDYSSEAESNPDHDLPDRIPEDGYYMKATNADKTKSQADRVGWYVAGSFKANRIIGDKEAHKVIDDWNVAHPDKKVEYDYERESGKEFNADTMQLEGEGKDRKEFRTKDGEVYGFVKDGKIYLDTEKMKPETPLHEYTHLWTEVLKSKNPKEWENVKKLFDEVKGLKEEVQKLYPELKGDDLYDEMIATYSGREGTKKLEDVVWKLSESEYAPETEADERGIFSKIKTALQKYWKGVADMLHIHFTNAEEVADKVLADWAKGVKPGEEKAVETGTHEETPQWHDVKIGLFTVHADKDMIERANKIWGDVEKYLGENPEATVGDIQRKFKIGANLASFVHAHWNEQNKMPLLPKNEKIDPETDPVAAAAEDFKKEHPMTEEQIMAVEEMDDEAKYTAIDYLNGEDDSEIARICYEQAYKNRKPTRQPKPAEPNTPAGSNAPADPKDGKTPVERVIEIAKTPRGQKPNVGKEPKTATQKKADAKKFREEQDKKTADLMQQFLDAGKDRNEGDSGKMLSTVIPIPSKAMEWMEKKLTLTNKQKEILPKLLTAIKGSMYARIKEGVYNLEDVIEKVRNDFKAFFGAISEDDANKILAEAAYKGRFTDPESGERLKLADYAERERKLSPEHKENLEGDSVKAEEKKIKEQKFIKALELKLAFGDKLEGIQKLREIAKSHGLEDVKDTDLQELAETAVVNRARKIMTTPTTSMEKKFEFIKHLYERQPSLNQRDSERVMKQQYSTPAPYAFLTNMYLTEGGKREVKSALEPSAGNGMLTIGLPMDAVHVNDIDAQRLANLRRQGFKDVTNQDGTQPFADKNVDAVVTNPPFGSSPTKEYDGYKIPSLEGQMAINALESMADDGRAAIIIGGKTEYADNGSLKPKDKALLGYLYSHYNVEDVINVDGSLYAKQGTTYPTRLILINGRRYDENVFPPVKSEARAETVKDYDELYKRINDDILQSERMDTTIGKGGKGTEPESDKPSPTDANDEGLRGGQRGGSKQKTPNGAGGVSDEAPIRVSNIGMGNGRGTKQGTNGGLHNTGAGENGAGTEPSQSEGTKNGTNPEGRVLGTGGNGRSDAEPDANGTAGAGDGSGSRGQLQRLDESVRGLSTEKVTYTPKSGNPFTLKAVMPADQQEAVNKNLEKLGDADQFLVDELGYNDKDDLYSHLAAEQIDSVALALHQAKQGNAFIIGDMTGIGKGRQAASLIRYAKKQGQVPVYFTEAAGLLSDVYRDLVDIGSPELRPFVFGSAKEAAITDSDGNVVFPLPSKGEVKRVLDYIEKNGKLPKEYDYVLTTYSQVSNGIFEFDENGNRKAKKQKKGSSIGAAALNGQRRRDAIEKLMSNGYLILDESHTAGGDSGRGNYFQHIIQKAKNVTFFSATFAKRPDNMPIYALRTAMNQGGMKSSDLIDAVRRGGATLQEIMSQTLTQCGQMIRRERDMTGVTIDWRAIDEPERVAEQREQYDNIIGLFNDIINFQKTYVKEYIDAQNEELARVQSSMGIKRGTASLGIKNVPFASKAFNIVQQVLLSLKAKSAAERAVEYLKQGMKPVIALNNTNESQTGSIALGEEMDAPDLGTSLKKGLEGTLRYTTKDSKDESSSGYIRLEELGADAVVAYKALEKKINEASTGLSLSPIDVIKNELEKAGYKVGELTGRSTEFVYNENGTVTKVKRADTDKKKLAREFNDGQIDALILNKSAATGISLHASSKYGDQRKRVMIVAQQQLDVNDEVQMRGRIDRTGQVQRGAYECVVSLIPAEQRLLMMFKAKLKSLDANTTSSQKSKFNEMEVADITNKYGDKVVREYMAEHLDLYSRMADPFGWEKSFGDDLSAIDPQKLISSVGGMASGEAGSDASKLLGRMALLKVEEQEKMLNEIGELYSNEIQRLNEMGENDLEITELPLKAKTVSKELWKEGAEPGGDNAFADNTYIEKVNMAILKKPMKAEEVKKAQDGLTGGKSWDEYKEEKKSEVKKYFDDKIVAETEKYEERAVRAATKAKEKYQKEAKRGQANSGMDDAEIEKMAGYQYNSIYEQEKEKLNDVIKNLKTKAEMFERVLETFNTEDAYVLPTDMNNPNELSGFGNSYGRLIDIKVTDNFSPNSSTVSFATLDGRRKITFPISGKVGSGENRTDVISTIDRLTRQASSMDDKHLRVLSMDVANWDRLVSNESRKDGYIVTGNLMQALIDSKNQGVGGQLVKYTTDTGEVRVGILMPDKFKPTDVSNEYPISSVVEKFSAPSHKGGIDEITSSDGDVKISQEYDPILSKFRYEIRVPKSNKKGGKYFLDKELLNMVNGNNFETRGNSMRASFEGDQLRPILERLSNLGVKVRDERKGQNDNVRYRKGEDEVVTREQERQEQMKEHRATVLKATEKLNTKTTIHDSVEDIKNETVRKAIENGEKIKAWYDVKTGEVHLYLPNVTDKYDAQKSVVHEVVGHKGMRNLLGESGYRDMMRRMYTHLSAEEAAEVNERMMKNGWDFYTAMDEWVADKAEESVWTPQEYPKYIGLSNLWSYIKHYVTEAIHKAGYNINPNVDDVKYWLWESKRALQNGDAYTEMKRNSFLWRLNHGTGKETLDDVINSPAYNHGDAQENVRYRKETNDDAMIEEAKMLFRKGSLDYSKNDTPQETATKDAIERRLGSWQYRETEAWKDHMASLDTTQKEMSKSIKNFDSSMDVYHGAINQSSVVAEKRANFERRELKDLQQALRKPTKALGGGKRGYENVNMYIYMKSGLERNRVLLVRDVAINIDTRIKKLNAELKEKDPKANVITYKGIEQYRDEFHAEKDYLTTLLEQGQIDLHQYYDKLDKFIRDFEFTKTGDNAVDAKINKLNKWYKDSVADKYDPNGNDYSGISSIVQHRVNGQFSDSAIIDAVMQAENTIGIDDVENLWSAVRGVTGYALESDHKYGIVSSAAKDRAKGMFNWYIPMRGFKEDSMEDSYAYMHSDSNKLASSSLKTAKGRTTLAQSPLGTAAAMAERAISRGEDNANKQRMYRLANAWLKEHTEEDGNGGMRLTEVPPVMVSDVWYEKKTDSLGNDYWEVATPDIKPDMSAEEIRKEIADFENDMKAKQAKGGATKTLQKGVYAKPFEDPMHKKQNIVTVWFGGKQRQIIFTGNPRAAQALNGELKSDAHQNALMRFMGGMFTSYNVTFSVSNLSRDTLFANNNISIRENAEYYARFTAMQARLLGSQARGMLTGNVHEKVRGEYFNMWAHYKQGKAPKGNLEKLFYEFMDNGGKTGFVKTKTIDNFEDEIRKNAGGRKAMETVGKVLHSLPEVIEGLNERAENLNRFACYATSRKMGRSIMRSISDAKEVSTNFNRRGLGGAAFDVPGANKAEKYFVKHLANWCQRNYLFFNAGMQSLRILQKNLAKHYIKTTINTIGIPMVLGGYLIPLLNQIIAGDDGEKYASLPEWDRRNNFCFYLGKNKWLKIPLPIELRGFYGLGDVARSVEDKRLQSANGVTLDAIAQLTQILPVDFMGEGMSPVNAVVPDVAKPMWQVANNEDWTGKPIYKDYDYMKYDPEYLKVYAGEFEPFVNLSKFINEASGGTAVTKGDWDGKWNNPAIWNNIVQGYFGGAGSDATRTAKIIKRLVTGDWDGFSTREIPMIRAMYSTPTEKTVYYRGLSKYAKYKELSDKYDHDMRVWKKNQDNPEISMKYNAELHGNSLDKRINALIKENEKVFKECRKIINSGVLSDDEAKAMQMQMDKAKLDLVNEIDNMK